MLTEPRVSDGARIWDFIKETGSLDLNSSYSYLMLCKFFSDTCIIANNGNNICGFISSYILPSEPEVLFIWQVAVSSSQRGKGLAKLLLHEVLKRKSCKDVSFIKTTVTPSNNASQALFQSFARDLRTRLKMEDCFLREDFPNGSHEEEELFVIGPFS